MNIVLFGAPGVGKGTQASLLATRLAVPHISTGAIFRAALDSGSDLGLAAKRYMDQGLLVPDDLTTAIALDALAEPACANGFILDGYPRNTVQAQSLDNALAAGNRSVDHVIHLVAPEHELIERMLGRGRTDDSREVIQNRLQVYLDETAPVLDYYRSNSRILDVNGVGEIEIVHERIMRALGSVA